MFRRIKKNYGYEYKLYNHLYSYIGKPYLNIIQYAKDVLSIINLIVRNK